MIYAPEHNDIVINFYRAKVYRFDKNNRQHYKDWSRCRYATFEERERFLKLDTETASINDVLDMTVRNRSKWDKKKLPPIVIEFTERTHAEFIKLARETGIYNYSELIDRIFTVFAKRNLSKNDETAYRELKRKYRSLEKFLEKIKKDFNEIDL